MATPNLNLQEIELTDNLRTDFVNKINNNMSILDERYGQLAEGLLEKTNQDNIEDAIDSLENLYDVSNATATPEDIALGKTAYVNGGLVTGTSIGGQKINVRLTGSTQYMQYIEEYGAGMDQNGMLAIWVRPNSTDYEHVSFVNTSIAVGTAHAGWNITGFGSGDPAHVIYACIVSGLGEYSTINVTLNVYSLNSTNDYITVRVFLTAE